MKQLLNAAWVLIAFLIVSTLIFLFVTPRHVYDFGGATRHMMYNNAKINRVLDSLYDPDTGKLKRYSHGGGAKMYRYIGWVTYKNGRWVKQENISK